jgi:hypothetical protein
MSSIDMLHPLTCTTAMVLNLIFIASVVWLGRIARTLPRDLHAATDDDSELSQRRIWG